MMDNIRRILIILHLLITIFLVYNRHHILSLVGTSLKPEKQISSIIVFINDLFRISFYHSACIIAIWYSRRYAAGMIRATGILLIGEFLQILAIGIEHLVEIHHIPAGELAFDVIYVWLFLAAILITFRLAKNISKYHKDLMQAELLTTTTSDLTMDGEGKFALV